MRFFTAIEIPSEIKDAIINLQRRSNFLRWVKAEQLHLTLTFLGEVDDKVVEELSTKLEEIKFESFEVALSGVGFFPSQHRARVFWIGVMANKCLNSLKNSIDIICKEYNIAVEKREFKPHLTIARITEVDQKEFAKFAKIYEKFNAKFICNSFTLYSSVLQKEGALHTPIKRYNSTK